MAINVEDYVSVAEAATMLKLTRQGVYHRIQRNVLPATRLLGKWVVAKADIVEALHMVDTLAEVEAALPEILSVKDQDADNGEGNREATQNDLTNTPQ